MKSAQFHIERLDRSRLFRRREVQTRRTQAEAKARAWYYVQVETRGEIWPSLIGQIFDEEVHQ